MLALDDQPFSMMDDVVFRHLMHCPLARPAEGGVLGKVVKNSRSRGVPGYRWTLLLGVRCANTAANILKALEGMMES